MLTNSLKVISCQEQIVRLLVEISLENIKELTFLKLNVEYWKYKMERRTYEYKIFFFHETKF